MSRFAPVPFPSLRAATVAAALIAVAGAASASEPRAGAEVYELVCRTCHEAGAGGAPKFGDRKAWTPLIAEGSSSLYRTAVRGIRGMPAKGGRPDLADVEVRRAVAYMANAAGARWPEPAK
ncbi:MAG: c-type cytochrome [Burkholderiales bacterium]|jgi:cytochrome c5